MGNCKRWMFCLAFGAVAITYYNLKAMNSAAFGVEELGVEVQVGGIDL
jgi:hypothetical protein